MSKTGFIAAFISLAAFVFGVIGKSFPFLFILIMGIPFARTVGGTTWPMSCQVGPILALWLSSYIRELGAGRRALAGEWVTVLGLVSLGWSCLAFLSSVFPSEVETMRETPTASCFLLATGMLGGIALYSLILKYVVDIDKIIQLMAAFVGTIVVLAFVVLLINVFHLTLPEPIVPLSYSEMTPGEDGRPGIASDAMFSGFHGYLENFGEYLFIVFAYLARIARMSIVKKNDPINH